MTDSTPMRLLSLEVRELVEQLSGKDIPEAALAESFYDLGLDSLLLTQAAQSIGRRFKTPLKLRHLAEDYPSCELLAGYLVGVVPAELLPQAAEPSAPSPAPVNPVPPTPPAAISPAVGALPTSWPTTAAAGSAVETIVRQQLALMARQMELLGARGLGASVQSVPLAPAANAASLPAVAPPAASPASVGGARPTPPPADAPTRPHGPQLVIERARGPELNREQERHIDRLIQRYTAKTGGSKAFTARNRGQIADPRTVAGFKPRLKELIYPIVVERSSGCHLWDVDGNEYVDLLSGYGSNFFGFGAPFVREAITAQLERGMEIGPQTHLVEDVATRFRRLVPTADRIAFCNTGSEAVLATFRLARTSTGRDLIVMFSGGYHGIFDEVVVRPTKRGSVPAAPGIPAGAVENLLVLPWASEEALEIIRQRADEIAGVIVEPVQSRAPQIQPVDFHRELRRITEQAGIALIWDEVVTGFRVAPGGAQEHFGIHADLASYGKVVGGGLSIGVVAGRRDFMDALDGGGWEYGDASIPEVGVTYFAGTFVRHPLHLAAARAVLQHLEEAGPELQRSVNAQTERFVAELNAALEQRGGHVKLHHFCSVMKVAQDSDLHFGELLFPHLRERGVHIWDGRPCFLTTAHTTADLEQVKAAFLNALDELQEGEIYPRPARQLRADEPPVPGARLGRDRSGKPTWYVPHPEKPGQYLPVEAP